tara:strand:- start:1097 stop:1252 length:156 start_codon:yes stop_codon:yes gene_type:complete
MVKKKTKKIRKKIKKVEKESLLWRAEANIGFMWLVPWVVLILIYIIIGTIT